MFDDYDNRLSNNKRNFGRNALNGDGNKIIEIYGKEVVSGYSDISLFVRLMYRKACRAKIPRRADCGGQYSGLAQQGIVQRIY
jgi:hypothetical protein